MPEQIMWHIMASKDVDETRLRAVLDAQFTGYNLTEIVCLFKEDGLKGGFESPLWDVSILSDEEPVRRCAAQIQSDFPSAHVRVFYTGPAMQVDDDGIVEGSEHHHYEIMTEDLDREGIEGILSLMGASYTQIRKTEGVYQSIPESSITIILWCEDREAVIKAATEIGIMNRQHTVALKRGDDVEFIQTWHEHTVGGESVASTA